MEYRKQHPKKDFVNRTIKLAHEFQNHQLSTTLQVNLLLGTVILPRAHWSENQNNNVVFTSDKKMRYTKSLSLETGKYTVFNKRLSLNLI